jgi:sulfite exporter TauE/SafE
MIDASIILPAFLLGFMGSTHCLGMCGGISAALGAANERRTFSLSLAYNLGRVLSYTVLGALVGSVAQAFSQPLLEWLPQAARWLRTLAGLMVIAMGFYLAGWWRGLAQLEKLGAYIWRYIQPLTKPLLPPKNSGAALLLGGLWGFLPCGLVYSSLAWAVLSADTARGALWMAAFGLGTLPAMLATTHSGSYLRRWKQQPVLRRSAAAMLIVAGIAASILPWQHSHMHSIDHGDHAEHAEHSDHAASMAPHQHHAPLGSGSILTQINAGFFQRLYSLGQNPTRVDANDRDRF